MITSLIAMISQEEFEEILADSTKLISSDISWNGDEDGSPTLEFRVKVDSEPGYPLVVKGSYNRSAQTLSYALIHRTFGRMYALDLGTEHRNPDGEYVGDRHLHWWEDGWRDRCAYVPETITADITQPVQVWQQFCKSIQVMHDGDMDDPLAPAQLEQD